MGQAYPAPDESMQAVIDMLSRKSGALLSLSHTHTHVPNPANLHQPTKKCKTKT